MARSSGTFTTESARAANRARLAQIPASRLTVEATAASPANLGRWEREVRAEHPDISDADVTTMAQARRSEYFRQLAARRHTKRCHDLDCDGLAGHKGPHHQWAID